MIIQIKKPEKLALLKALKDGYLNTDTVPQLKEALDKARPARILTKKEAKDLIKNIENEC